MTALLIGGPGHGRVQVGRAAATPLTAGCAVASRPVRCLGAAIPANFANENHFQ